MYTLACVYVPVYTYAFLCMCNIPKTDEVIFFYTLTSTCKICTWIWIHSNVYILYVCTYSVFISICKAPRIHVDLNLLWPLRAERWSFF